MNEFLHSVALFLHIAGAFGFFAVLVLEWTGLRQIRAAMRADPVRSWLGILRNANKVGFPCMVLTVLTGIYMMLTDWGLVPWLLVTLGALVVIIALSRALTMPRLQAIGRALGKDNETTAPAFAIVANDPLLWISIQTRIAIVLGIVFLKVTTPGLVGALATILVAAVLGFGSALRTVQAPRGQKAAAD